VSSVLSNVGVSQQLMRDCVEGSRLFWGKVTVPCIADGYAKWAAPAMLDTLAAQNRGVAPHMKRLVGLRKVGRKCEDVLDQRVRNKRSIGDERSPPALTSDVSVTTQGSPFRRRKAVKCRSKRQFRLRSPGRGRRAKDLKGTNPYQVSHSNVVCQPRTAS
jgi:hypothetical protein